VYAVNGTLFAVPFDVKRLAVTGGSSPVLEGVRRFTNPGQTGVAHFSVSDTGSLIYIPGPVAGTAGNLQNPLVLIDRTGNAKTIPLPPGAYRSPRVSPDGKQIAFWTNGPKEYSVWIYELSGATSMRRLNIGGASRYPIWSADSQHVAFQTARSFPNVRDDGIAISWQLADGTGVAEQLMKAEVGLAPVPEAWSPTSQNFLFSIGKENGGGISLRTLSILDKKSDVFAESGSHLVARSVFSPNGQWVAYQSNETGRNEIFVQPFPVTGTKYQISKDGGRQPLWSPDGKELFYNSTPAGVGRLMSVKMATRPSFTWGNPTPTPIDGIAASGGGAVRDFDITPDGKFIVVKSALLPSDRTPLQVQVVLNWFGELQERVPVK
jgi:serine/threonine-protein kinase